MTSIPLYRENNRLDFHYFTDKYLFDIIHMTDVRAGA